MIKKFILITLCSLIAFAFPQALFAQQQGKSKVTNPEDLKPRSMQFPPFPADKHISGPMIDNAAIKNKAVLIFTYKPGCSVSQRLINAAKGQFNAFYNNGKLVFIVNVIDVTSKEEVKLNLGDDRISLYYNVDIPPKQAGSVTLITYKTEFLTCIHAAQLTTAHMNVLLRNVPEPLSFMGESIVFGEPYATLQSQMRSPVGAEAKIKPLRAKKDADANAICTAFDAWLLKRENEITAQLETAPLAATQAILEMKTISPTLFKKLEPKLKKLKSIPKFETVTKAMKKTKDFNAKGNYKRKDLEKIQKQMSEIETDNPQIKAAIEEVNTLLKTMLAE